MVYECPDCKDLGCVRFNLRLDHPDFGKLFPCHCQAWSAEERGLAKLVAMSRLSKQELSRTLDALRDVGGDTAIMKQKARAFVADPYGWFTLWGSVGNGKTLTLQAMVNELRTRRGMAGVYITMKDLLDYLRAGFEDGGFTERQRYEHLRTVPVLAIDEVDKVRLTDYARELRSAFFDDRYRLGKAGETFTLFAMNRPPSELPSHLYDRMRDGRFQIVSNHDTSMRPVMERGVMI